MKASSFYDFQILESQIIDWYDGVVSALIKINKFPGWSYVSLISWDKHTGEKTYAVLPIKNSNYIKLSDIIKNELSIDPEGRWSLIRDEVQRIVSNFKGSAVIVTCKELDQQVISVSQHDLDYENLRSFIGLEIDTIVQKKLPLNLFK